MVSPVDVALRTDDGVRLHARHSDNGTRGIGCVLAHGFTMTSRHPHLRRIAASLIQQGFGVLAIDLRGHGRSAGLSTAGADETFDIDAAVGWLRTAGYERVVTMGWSMGGSAVLRHAGLGGDSDAVVSVSSPGTWHERGTRPMRLVHWLFEHRSGRLATRVLRHTRISPYGWHPVPAPPADVVASITAPVLIVHGDRDRYFPRHHVESLAAGAPSAQVWIEAGMGHAEIASDDELLARIGRWALEACDRLVPVCDDERRD